MTTSTPSTSSVKSYLDMFQDLSRASETSVSTVTSLTLDRLLLDDFSLLSTSPALLHAASTAFARLAQETDRTTILSSPWSPSSSLSRWSSILALATLHPVALRALTAHWHGPWLQHVRQQAPPHVHEEWLEACVAYLTRGHLPAWAQGAQVARACTGTGRGVLSPARVWHALGDVSPFLWPRTRSTTNTTNTESASSYPPDRCPSDAVIALIGLAKQTILGTARFLPGRPTPTVVLRGAARCLAAFLTHHVEEPRCDPHVDLLDFDMSDRKVGVTYPTLESEPGQESESESRWAWWPHDVVHARQAIDGVRRMDQERWRTIDVDVARAWLWMMVLATHRRGDGVSTTEQQKTRATERCGEPPRVGVPAVVVAGLLARALGQDHDRDPSRLTESDEDLRVQGALGRESALFMASWMPLALEAGHAPAQWLDPICRFRQDLRRRLSRAHNHRDTVDTVTTEASDVLGHQDGPNLDDPDLVQKAWDHVEVCIVATETRGALQHVCAVSSMDASWVGQIGTSVAQWWSTYAQTVARGAYVWRLPRFTTTNGALRSFSVPLWREDPSPFTSVAAAILLVRLLTIRERDEGDEGGRGKRYPTTVATMESTVRPGDRETKPSPSDRHPSEHPHPCPSAPTKRRKVDAVEHHGGFLLSADDTIPLPPRPSRGHAPTLRPLLLPTTEIISDLDATSTSTITLDPDQDLAAVVATVLPDALARLGADDLDARLDTVRGVVVGIVAEALATARSLDRHQDLATDRDLKTSLRSTPSSCGCAGTTKGTTTRGRGRGKSKPPCGRIPCQTYVVIATSFVETTTATMITTTTTTGFDHGCKAVKVLSQAWRQWLMAPAPGLLERAHYVMALSLADIRSAERTWCARPEETKAAPSGVGGMVTTYPDYHNDEVLLVENERDETGYRGEGKGKWMARCPRHVVDITGRDDMAARARREALAHAISWYAAAVTQSKTKTFPTAMAQTADLDLARSLVTALVRSTRCSINRAQHMAQQRIMVVPSSGSRSRSGPEPISNLYPKPPPTPNPESGCWSGASGYDLSTGSCSVHRDGLGSGVGRAVLSSLALAEHLWRTTHGTETEVRDHHMDGDDLHRTWVAVLRRRIEATCGTIRAVAEMLSHEWVVLTTTTTTTTTMTAKAHGLVEVEGGDLGRLRSLWRSWVHPESGWWVALLQAVVTDVRRLRDLDQTGLDHHFVAPEVHDETVSTSSPCTVIVSTSHVVATAMNQAPRVFMMDRGRVPTLGAFFDLVSEMKEQQHKANEKHLPPPAERGKIAVRSEERDPDVDHHGTVVQVLRLRGGAGGGGGGGGSSRHRSHVGAGTSGGRPVQMVRPRGAGVNKKNPAGLGGETMRRGHGVADVGSRRPPPRAAHAPVPPVPLPPTSAVTPSGGMGVISGAKKKKNKGKGRKGKSSTAGTRNLHPHPVTHTHTQ